MAKFVWYNGEVPNNLKIKQVYGILFTKDGRILLAIKDKGNGKIFTLAGGKPESYDEDNIATLKRELIEEVNVTINTPITVGYQEVDEENGNPTYAQFRMAAIIDSIGPRLPDPDTNETYERILTTPIRAIELLDWGDVGKLQIEEAVKVAKEKLGITTFSNKEELV